MNINREFMRLLTREHVVNVSYLRLRAMADELEQREAAKETVRYTFALGPLGEGGDRADAANGATPVVPRWRANRFEWCLLIPLALVIALWGFFTWQLAVAAVTLGALVVIGGVRRRRSQSSRSM